VSIFFRSNGHDSFASPIRSVGSRCSAAIAGVVNGGDH